MNKFPIKHFAVKIILLLQFVSINGFGQLLINTAPSPTQLVQNVLVGSGVTVSNISYSGSASSRGSFSNGNATNLGLNNGIILSTTNAANIANPVSYFLNMNLGLAGDVDLNAINYGTATYDACVLEFDFVPLSDTVKFRYVFGSEEYPNFVCSQFQDIFAFFVDGPNPAGGNYNNYNIALIPGTALPVSVNSINNGTPGGSYSSSGCISLSYPSFYVDNAALTSTTIAFGGFTKPLTAWCRVTPCQTYHMKLAVADGYNGLYDSGVFLEASSFTSNICSLNTSYPNSVSGNNAVEGCNQGVFSFTLQNPVTQPYTINYTVSGTAVNGADYTTIPASVTIPAGSDSVAVVISPVADGLPESTETVIITYTTNCVTQTDTIFISDNVPVVPNATGDTTICPAGTALLSVASSGGTPPMTYYWSVGSGANVSVSPTLTTTYIVTATDNCGQTATDDVLVNVSPLGAAVSVTPENCGQGNGTATATATGPYLSGLTYLWNTVPQQSTQTATGLAAGNYTVTVSYGSCTTTASANVNNTPGPATTISAVVNTLCSLPNGSATVGVTGGTPPYTFQWSSNPPQSTPTLTNVIAGTYYVTVTDAAGCISTNSVILYDLPGPTATITGFTDASCGQSDGQATLNVSGGTPAYTYNWNSNPPQLTQNLSDVPTGTYTVTVTDSNSCSFSTSVVVGELPGPIATITTTNEDCSFADGTATASPSGGTGSYTYLWSNGDTISTITGLTSAQYSVTINDGFCIFSTTAFVAKTPGPEANFSIRPEAMAYIDDAVLFFDHSTGNVVSWLWNFGDGSPAETGAQATHSYTALGTYQVTLVVTDDRGCVDSISETVLIRNTFALYIPNSFTPNSDGNNDVFAPQGTSVDPDKFSMTIFDRWGKCMFTTTKWNDNTSEGWNGTPNNKGTAKDLVMGVYVYFISAKEIGGYVKEYRGRILLIR